MWAVFFRFPNNELSELLLAQAARWPPSAGVESLVHSSAGPNHTQEIRIVFREQPAGDIAAVLSIYNEYLVSEGVP